MVLRSVRVVVCAVLVGCAAAVVTSPPAYADVSVVGTTLVSAMAVGEPGSADSQDPAMTPDGRYVTYLTYAPNLAADAPAGQTVVLDRQTHVTELVSRSSAGDPGDLGGSDPAGISADGRIVVFDSSSTNLAPGYHNGFPQGVPVFAYLRDRQAGTTVRLGDPSLVNSDVERNGLSDDGTVVVYTGIADPVNFAPVVYVYDRVSGTTQALPAGARDPALSADGRYVAYDDPTGTHTYRYDRQTQQTVEIGGGGLGTVLSADGATGVYFAVDAAGTGYDLFVQNIATGASTRVIGGSNTAAATSLVLSRTGRYLSYYYGTTLNNRYVGQIWVADLLTGQRLLVDSGAAKRVGTGLTADGSELAFTSFSRLTGGDGPLQVFVASLAGADSTAPVLGTPVWSVNPKTVTQTATLTVPATDSGSGVAGGEYWLGDTDPGTGAGTAMGWDGTNLTAAFGTGLAPGVYRVNVRARDVAGNWSTATVDYLVVYDPNGPSVSGKKSVVPSLAGGDVLPGLVGPGQTDRATFGFTVRYDNGGVVSAKSDAMLDYATGTSCHKPTAVNCHQLTLNATAVSWLYVDGINGSEAVFQGQASVTVDGVTTTNPFRITAVDGTRLDPVADDHLTVAVYPPGANPNADAPLYRLSEPVTRGNIRIR